MNEKVTKPWGSFTTFYQEDGKLVKLIEVNDNARLSLQSHKKRDEQWVVVSGKILVTLIKMKEYWNCQEHYVLEEGEDIIIDRGVIHRMQAINGPAKVMEITTGKHDEKDIVRYEDDYERKGTTAI